MEHVASTWKGVATLWRQGQETELPLVANGARISGSGQFVFGYRADDSLAAYDLRGQQVVELAERVTWYDFSEDASAVVYGQAGSAFVLDLARRTPRPIVLNGEQAVGGALSANGRVLFLLTAASGILRVELATGVAEAIVPALALPPLIGGWSAAPSTVTPGSLVRLTATEPQRVPDRVWLSGRPVAPVASSAREVWFQVPSSQASGPLWVEVDLPEPIDHPFDAAVALRPLLVVPLAPAFFSAGTAGGVPVLVAAHEDFSGLVTLSSPARPGEIVHLYGTGFGLVDPPVADGAPASANPLSLAVNRPACRLGQQTLETLFAGLAPGLVGVFQLDVRLPAAFDQTSPLLVCSLPGAATAPGLLSLAP